MKNVDTIAVLDFGGQYAHLIANRVRRLGVFTEIHSPAAPVSELEGVKGIIYSGGPSSVYAADAPEYNPEILNLPVPKLGICYGHQLIAQQLGGHVEPGKVKEYGIADLIVGDEKCPILNEGPPEGLPDVDEPRRPGHQAPRGLQDRGQHQGLRNRRRRLRQRQA